MQSRCIKVLAPLIDLAKGRYMVPIYFFIKLNLFALSSQRHFRDHHRGVNLDKHTYQKESPT